MNLDLRGRVSGLVSRVGSMGCNSCGCEEAPAAEPAPACESACGCGRPAVVKNIVARMPRPGQNCGCEETPACEETSACDDPCKANLLDRIRQVGNRCNDGRRVFPNSGCSDCETTTEPQEAAPADEQAANGISVDPELFMSFRG